MDFYVVLPTREKKWLKLNSNFQDTFFYLNYKCGNSINCCCVKIACDKTSFCQLVLTLVLKKKCLNKIISDWIFSYLSTTMILLINRFSSIPACCSMLLLFSPESAFGYNGSLSCWYFWFFYYFIFTSPICPNRQLVWKMIQLKQIMLICKFIVYFDFFPFNFLLFCLF